MLQLFRRAEIADSFVSASLIFADESFTFIKVRLIRVN
jgi:hypothetical protein